MLAICVYVFTVCSCVRYVMVQRSREDTIPVVTLFLHLGVLGRYRSMKYILFEAL
jgi:hypothetical protein